MVKRIGQRTGERRRTFFREWRLHRELTQEQLAERLGTTKAAVSKIELGQNLYNQSSLEAWASALMCEPSDLISRRPDDDDLNSLFEKASDDVKSVLYKFLKAGI